MTQRSKAYRKAAELIEPDKIYSPLEAANIAKAASPTKFDGTVEVAIRLGVDPRKADQMVRGTVSLPHGGQCIASCGRSRSWRAAVPGRRASVRA